MVLAPPQPRFDVHPAREEDLAAAFTLAARERDENPWIDRVPDILRNAVDGDGEYSACIATQDGEIVGLGAFGMVAGTVGTAIVHGVIVASHCRREGVGQKILLYIATELSKAGARVIFAEVPGDPCMMRYRALLLAYGFIEEARIEDYYRDGIPQIISRLDR
ncbi:MAG TPA: GNAT family N-acetyltransferase [Gemmatimonadaceae bacterium]|nr:GNAT family N-acetyltransferase [Gemmatimonadaceae bacterium]